MQTFLEILLSTVNGILYVLMTVVGFWFFDLGLHTDLFTAAAIVAFIAAPSVNLD